jgi:enoyl-CoA hydratase
MSNSLTYEVDGPIATLTLNRPDKLNAINSDMIEAINLAMDDAEDNYNVRAIILQAEGRAFSAGFDLDDEVWDSKEESNIRQALESDFNMVMRFWDSPKPTIAAVQGYCLGGAMEMALACDITVASDDALFGEPEVSIASGVVALILPWLTGPKLAKELLLTADIKISSQRIYEMGLINRITAPENLRDEALTMAETIAANDRLSVEITKKAINRTMEIAGMRAALLDGLEADILLETSQSDEAKQFNEILDKEGLKAALAWRRSTVLKK